jgi:protein tyrosine phosphatase (PTP) superfamily phosphohydrolase (DUF442 family)
MRSPLFLTALLAVALLSSACDGDAKTKPAEAKAPDAKAAHEKAAGERVKGVAYDDHGAPAGLHRYHKWSENVGQGAQPEGDIAFKNLKALGYKTILSVDGSVPDVEGAKKHGLRYVHVPIGYDGVPEELALKIAATLQVSGGPVFVHCHHGKHRGPAAAMVLRICADKIPNAQALKEMEASKTSKNYTGLYRDIAAYKAPAAAELAKIKELPSKVLPKGLRAGMVDVNLRFEHLQLCKEAGWKQPKDHPDISPPHEARMLWELYREMGRNDTECRDKGEVFLAYMKAGEEAAIELEKAIRAGDAKIADKHYAVVKKNCQDCHEQYRN